MKFNRDVVTRRHVLKLASGLPAVMAVPYARADTETATWPNRPVKLVLAIGPGSSGDLIARMIKPHLETLWKQPVIVENRPGAGGIIGSQYVAKATDNHTLLMASHSSILPKYTKKDLSYDPLVDLAPVYKIVNYQMFLGVNGQKMPSAKTLQELIAQSRATPEGLIFAGLGRTASYNIAMAVLNRGLGLQFTAMDFNSIGEMNLALLRGDAQFALNTPSAVTGQLESGAIRPLAVLSSERYTTMPAVPTIGEATGYKGYMPRLWAGVMAPRTMPAPLIARIAHDIEAVVLRKDVKAQLETNVTGTVLKSSPSDYAREVREETGIWEEVFRELKIVPQ